MSEANRLYIRVDEAVDHLKCAIKLLEEEKNRSLEEVARLQSFLEKAVEFEIGAVDVVRSGDSEYVIWGARTEWAREEWDTETSSWVDPKLDNKIGTRFPTLEEAIATAERIMKK